MKAVIKKGYEDHLIEYTDIPKPEVGEFDVLVKVKAAGICGSDLSLLYGKVEGKTVDYPIVIGHEFSGEIVEVGEKVTAWKVGDRVISDNTGYVCGKCHACASGQYLFCADRKGMGNDMDGGFAQYVKIPGQVLNVFPNCLQEVPEGVSFEYAAAIEPFCNAYKAVIQEARLLPGQTIVVFGAGALGLFSIQAANIGSAGKIIVVGTSDDEEVRFKKAAILGATDFVVADKDDVVTKIKEIAGPEGVAVAVDCAGPGIVLKQSIDIVRNGGIIVKIGYSHKPLDFSLDTMALKGITLIGHMGYDTASWKNSLVLLKDGRVNMDAIISHTLPLEKWEEGFTLVKERKATKVLLIPPAEA